MSRLRNAYPSHARITRIADTCTSRIDLLVSDANLVWSTANPGPSAIRVSAVSGTLRRREFLGRGSHERRSVFDTAS
jgi:hypothetical protein